MARQTAAERAEAARANEQAREAKARADLAAKKREVAEVLGEVLGDLLTSVQRSSDVRHAQSGDLDRLLATKPWPPRFSGGGHRDGQIVPHRFSIFSWLKAVPSIFEPFMPSNGAGEVPDDFWALDELEDGSKVAVVSCPCGDSPVVGHGRFHFCPGEECTRVFLNLGDSVRVARLTDEQLDALAGPDDA